MSTGLRDTLVILFRDMLPVCEGLNPKHRDIQDNLIPKPSIEHHETNYAQPLRDLLSSEHTLN